VTEPDANQPAAGGCRCTGGLSAGRDSGQRWSRAAGGVVGAEVEGALHLQAARLITAYIRRRLPNLAEAAGIHKRVRAHGLRHTHAAELRAEGVDIGITSEQLGHVSIATTIRYLDHTGPRAVVEAVAGRMWIAGFK